MYVHVIVCFHINRAVDREQSVSCVLTVNMNSSCAFALCVLLVGVAADHSAPHHEAPHAKSGYGHDSYAHSPPHYSFKVLDITHYSICSSYLTQSNFLTN